MSHSVQPHLPTSAFPRLYSPKKVGFPKGGRGPQKKPTPTLLLGRSSTTALFPLLSSVGARPPRAQACGPISRCSTALACRPGSVDVHFSWPPLPCGPVLPHNAQLPAKTQQRQQLRCRIGARKSHGVTLSSELSAAERGRPGGLLMGGGRDGGAKPPPEPLPPLQETPQMTATAPGNDPQPAEDVLKPSPEQAANFLSRLTFWWLGGVIKEGYSKPLELRDLPALPDSDNAKRVATRFAGAWARQSAKPKASLETALFSNFRGALWWGAALQFVSTALQLTPSVFLNAVLLYIEKAPTNNFMKQIFGKDYGYYAAGALLLVPTFRSLVDAQFYHIMFRLGVHVKTALIEIVYSKSLMLSNSARQSKSVGEIVTLMQVDTDKVSMTTTFLHSTWSALLLVAGTVALLCYYIGWSALAGVALLIVTIPTQSKLVNKMLKMQRATLLNTGKRVKVVNEILQGMKVVKAYAWERPFQESIRSIRSAELAAMRRRVYLRAVQAAIMLATPVLIMVVTFTFYSAVAGRTLTAATVFTALSLFNQLRIPLMMYPMVINAVLEGHVSLKRLSVFLKSEELQPLQREGEGSDAPSALSVEKSTNQWATLLEVPKDKKVVPGNKDGAKVSKKSSWNRWSKKGKWSKDGNTKVADSTVSTEAPFSLEGISIDVPWGAMVAVCGPVGSGKSSLAAALLGEMGQKSGQPARVGGSVAYCAQQAWILNTSLRENVLFGHEYEEERYDAAIKACALNQDLAALPDGDLTEIGERGINLSGGQKQRVSLARAVYADADIYILDDPLSAVDAHVGSYLFEHCINGILASKSRLFITNQLQYVPAADHIVVLKDGKIVEQGTYQVVMDNNGAFATLMKESGSHKNEDTETAVDVPAKKLLTKVSTNKARLRDGASTTAASTFSKQGTLVDAEMRAKGMLKLDVYKKYWFEASLWLPWVLLGMFCFVQAIDAYQRYWLAYWTKDQFDQSLAFYLGIYAGIALLYTVLVYVRTLMHALLGLWIANILYEGMLKSICQAPMSFFDTTPVGRILNRFSSDQSAVDDALPFSWSTFLNILFQVFSTIIVICITTPIFTAVFVPVAGIYFYVQLIYRRTARELKRLESLTKSPVYQQFTETLNGLTTIRAYNQQERFLRMCDAKLDNNNRAFFLLRSCDRWLSVRLEFMGNAMVTAAAFLAVADRGSLYAGYAGISIGYALQITASLSMLVRQMTDTENQMNSVERMLEYRDKIDHEAPGIIDEHRPPPDWPSQGAIEIEGLSMRYRSNLPFVLKEVSVSVKGGEKVGVVGRTGSGKSSLMLCLFRLVEPASGSIWVDGVDIREMGLEDLRSRLSIIPQDPILFSGTVRSNLDPFANHSDDELWQTLERSHLKEKVAGLAKKLDSDVVEYGENFSMGERQLLCLARVLLRKSRILVMDEATSSVDFETDQLIQRTIRTHLQDTTMLIIAHRINTVIDASRILVLSDGEVVEYDKPVVLLDTPGSSFAALVQDTGEQTAEHLRKVARGELDFFATYEEDTVNGVPPVDESAPVDTPEHKP
eukprot:SM000015S01312  [mRNA]  locus=s15:1174764:1185983:- [translate_table: standard]